MKRFFSLFLAVSSLLQAVISVAATRPSYGGTVHVAMQAAPTTLDPVESDQADWFASRNLSYLLFDRLVSFDDHGNLRPALATSWHADSGDQRWQFSLRNGVRFTDGSPLTADVVAGSL